MKPAIFLIFTCLLGTSPAYAHGGGHGGGEERPSTPIPETFPGLVAALRAHHAVAATALKANKLDQMYSSAQAFWDLAAAAPGKGAALPAGAKSTIAAKAHDVQEQANAFFSKARAGDAVRAQAALDAISADIDALAVLAK